MLNNGADDVSHVCASDQDGPFTGRDAPRHVSVLRSSLHEDPAVRGVQGHADVVERRAVVERTDDQTRPFTGPRDIEHLRACLPSRQRNVTAGDLFAGRRHGRRAQCESQSGRRSTITPRVLGDCSRHAENPQ